MLLRAQNMRGDFQSNSQIERATATAYMGQHMLRDNAKRGCACDEKWGKRHQKYVGKYQSCMISKLRIILWKRTRTMLRVGLELCRARGAGG